MIQQPQIEHTRANQCSYCGGYGQKVCWECYSSDLDELREENKKLRERLETLEFKFNELIDVLKNNGVASELLVFTKVKEAGQ